MTNAAVLIVDEEALIRMESVDIVKDAGFIALEARNAEEAIGILATRSDIRLVFLEIKISGSIDGLRLAHAIHDRWPPVHLVLTSGLIVTSEDKLPEGALFLRKPYASEHITAALSELLSYHPERIGGVSRRYQSWRQSLTSSSRSSQKALGAR